MRSLATVAVSLAAVLWVGCGKSSPDKGTAPSAQTPKTAPPSAPAAPGGEGSTQRAGAPPPAAAVPPSEKPTSVSAEPTPATAPAPGEEPVNAGSGAPSPVMGLDLASASAGVLSRDLDLRTPPPSKPVPAATGASGKRHPSCAKLLACTRDAVALAPDSVTSYAVTLESVDSLEPAEAEAECTSDYKDVVQILKHLKHPLPKSCQ